MRSVLPILACAPLLASSALASPAEPVLADTEAHWIQGGDVPARRTSGLALWGGSGHLLAVRDNTSTFPLVLVKGEDGTACCTPERFSGPGGLDLEGIAFLGGDDASFLAVSEGSPWRLIHGRRPVGGPAGVLASWKLPCVEPEEVGCDSNRGFEGIAFELGGDGGGFVYLAYEGPEDGPPGLFRLTLDKDRTSISDWREHCRRPAGERNAFSGLELAEIGGRRLLLVLQRDDPNLLVYDLDRGALECSKPTCSLRLELLSPNRQKIHEPSPEGIAYHPDAGSLYLTADPAVDRWRLEGVDEHGEAASFEARVPLLWKIENMPAQLMSRGCLARGAEDQEEP